MQPQREGNDDWMGFRSGGQGFGLRGLLGITQLFFQHYWISSRPVASRGTDGKSLLYAPTHLKNYGMTPRYPPPLTGVMNWQAYAEAGPLVAIYSYPRMLLFTDTYIASLQGTTTFNYATWHAH